ncbi:MAG: SDH family Clp fold serine proteinase [Acidimicrobiales bacterium]
MAREDRPGETSEGVRGTAERGQAEELPAGNRQDVLNIRTPLFSAQHSERYARQQLIRDYEDMLGADLVVIIDQIFPPNMTFLEELLFDCDVDKPLHVLLASPGGDGETAIRMVRSMQARCSELTIMVPDLAKSAATLLCLGAHRIVMGPGGDLGPVDPQLLLGSRSLASAKEIVAAIDEAEARVKAGPETFPLFAGLLQDVNMLMVEQARSALGRTEALVAEALACCPGRTEDDVATLAASLNAPLIDDPQSHSAVISVQSAQKFGLPAEEADSASPEWKLVWSL